MTGPRPRPGVRADPARSLRLRHDGRREVLGRRIGRPRLAGIGRLASPAEPHLERTGSLDGELLEFAFDAQTSGGLLISVAADKAEQLVAQVRSDGAEAACIVGRVETRQDAALVIGQ